MTTVPTSRPRSPLRESGTGLGPGMSCQTPWRRLLGPRVSRLLLKHLFSFYAQTAVDTLLQSDARAGEPRGPGEGEAPPPATREHGGQWPGSPGPEPGGASKAAGPDAARPSFPRAAPQTRREPGHPGPPGPAHALPRWNPTYPSVPPPPPRRRAHRGEGGVLCPPRPLGPRHLGCRRHPAVVPAAVAPVSLVCPWWPLLPHHGPLPQRHQGHRASGVTGVEMSVLCLGVPASGRRRASPASTGGHPSGAPPTTLASLPQPHASPTTHSPVQPGRDLAPR